MFCFICKTKSVFHTLSIFVIDSRLDTVIDRLNRSGVATPEANKKQTRSDIVSPL